MPDEEAEGALRVVVADDNPVVRAGLTALLDGRAGIRVVAEAADGAGAVAAVRRCRPDVLLLDVRMPGTDGLAALSALAGRVPVLMLTYSGDAGTVREAVRLGARGYLVHGEFTAGELVAAVRWMRDGRGTFTPTARDALLERRVARGSSVGDPLMVGGTSPVVTSIASQMQRVVGQLERAGEGDRSADRSNHSPRWDRRAYGLSSREVEVMDLIASGMNNRQIAAACFISEKTVKNHINRIFAKVQCVSRSEAIARWLGTAHAAVGEANPR
ncbi:response regulator transcription factor [Streptomyces sp. NPDC091292]|uniref:response regulator transcription factor n=1 Tax=Streptomyces sp. NPDC091292 TaxID=3365991 RepID=UPI00381E09E3